MRLLRYGQLCLLLAALSGLALGAGLDQIYLRHVGHDQAWCLYAADLVLRGVTLNGPRLVEVNPPFIIWFSALPVMLGSLLHIGMLNGFRLFFDVLVLVSLVWTTLLLRRLFQPRTLTVWLFVMAQVMTSLWLITKDSLGQREHLMVLLVLPYLVLAAGRLCGRSVGWVQSVVIGVAAAIAISLKPQHVLMVILVELLLVVRLRRFDAVVHPATVAFVAGLFVYVGSVFLFGRTYLENVMPQLRLAYWGLNHPWSEVFPNLLPVVLGLLVFGVVLYRGWGRIALRELSLVFGTAAIGSGLVYLQQHKGWRYQLIPSGLFAVLFIAAVVMGIAEVWRREESPADGRETAAGAQRRVLIALACGVLALAADWKFGHRDGYYNAKKRALAEIFSAYPEGSAVSYLATQPWDMPLVIEQHKVLGQRVNYFWLLPAILRGPDPKNPLHETMKASAVRELSAIQLSTETEDLERWKPVVVVVDQCGPELCDTLHREGYASLLAWFLKDPGFARQWQHYRPVERQGDLEVFQRMN